MKNFKEWLSDYLRYIMLLLAAVLIFFLVLIGVRLYQRGGQQGSQDVIEVYPESETEGSGSVQESGTEQEKNSEKESETGSVDKPELARETGQATEAPSQAEPESESATKTTETSSGLLPENETGVTIVRQTETEAKTTPALKKETEPVPAPQPITETEPPTEPPTEAPTEPPEPVYMTLTGSCYIRSGPGYEYEIIGEYMYGTTVQVLDDSSGWYKVQVDGMTGYMGSRFFH